MKANWKSLCAGLVVLAGLSARTLGQVPAPPANGGSATGSPTGAAGAPAPAAPSGVVGLVQMLAGLPLDPPAAQANNAQEHTPCAIPLLQDGTRQKIQVETSP